MQSMIRALSKFNYIVVSSHISPDGDNVGSSIGLTRFLKNLGKQTAFIMDDEIPPQLHFLLEESIRISSEEFLNKMPSTYAMVILDCGHPDRIVASKKIIEQASLLINIDHHISNPLFGDYYHVEPDASSTCELIYQFIKQWDASQITALVAEALYTGILTDTGNFKYESADSKTLQIASELLSYPIRKTWIIEHLFQSHSLGWLHLLGELLSEIEMHQHGISFMSISQKSLKKHQISYSETEEIVPYLMYAKDAVVGIMCKEKSAEEIKVSFRSKHTYDVNQIASHFGGGGHKRAAGCTIKKPMNIAKLELLSFVTDWIQREKRNH